MKACISEPRKYLPRFFLFILIFFGILCSMIFLGRILSPTTQEAISENPSLTEDKRPVIVIDAGHGGEDGGTVGVNGVYEKDLNLKIALLLNDWLSSEGFETVLTRSEDILLYDKTSNYLGQKKVQDLANRRKITEEYENAVLVSIHMNAFPQAKYSGLQVYYSPHNPSSQVLANEIQNLTRELLQPENTRKIKSAGENIYLLDRLRCPAVLIECGFLSNPQECANLSKEDYQKKLAFSIYLSIVNYFNAASKNP